MNDLVLGIRLLFTFHFHVFLYRSLLGTVCLFLSLMQRFSVFILYFKQLGPMILQKHYLSVFYVWYVMVYEAIINRH